jgi:hypothetical protein
MARRGISESDSDWQVAFDPNEFQYTSPGNFEFTASQAVGTAVARGAAADPASSAGLADGHHDEHDHAAPDLHLVTEGTATMAAPAVAAPQPVAHDITFNLVNIGGVTPGSSAEAGFQRAAFQPSAQTSWDRPARTARWFPTRRCTQR